MGPLDILYINGVPRTGSIPTIRLVLRCMYIARNPPLPTPPVYGVIDISSLKGLLRAHTIVRYSRLGTNIESIRGTLASSPRHGAFIAPPKLAPGPHLHLQRVYLRPMFNPRSRHRPYRSLHLSTRDLQGTT